jgi:hypothetical protein
MHNLVWRGLEIATFVRLAGLVFLGSSPFRPETPDYERWINLDFLGFPRLNLDFSMGYAGFSAKEISCAPPPLKNGGDALRAFWGAQFLIPAAYLNF